MRCRTNYGDDCFEYFHAYVVFYEKVHKCSCADIHNLDHVI